MYIFFLLYIIYFSEFGQPNGSCSRCIVRILYNAKNNSILTSVVVYLRRFKLMFQYKILSKNGIVIPSRGIADQFNCYHLLCKIVYIIVKFFSLSLNSRGPRLLFHCFQKYT